MQLKFHLLYKGPVCLTMEMCGLFVFGLGGQPARGFAQEPLL